MHGDIERTTFKARKHYSGVYRQQGRVDVSADWNEQVAIAAHRVETEASDVIGRSGGPKHNAAFRILSGGSHGDFKFTCGRYYVDGILCENERVFSFTSQPDYHPEPIHDPGQYLVYLDVWRRPITAIEDPEIREVALGGADTATRTKVVWQVKVLRVGNLSDNPNQEIRCSSELEQWKLLTCQSDATLCARAQPDPESDSICVLPPKAGYRGLGNQLYRVEIHRGGQTNASNASNVATFKWSRDNGSPSAAIAQLVGNTVTLASARPDGGTGFAPGDWIELLDDSYEWNGRPGIIVPVTEVDNLVLTVDTSRGIDPQSGGIGPVTLALDTSLHPKIRRWDVAGETSPVRNAELGPGDGFIKLEDGIEIKFGHGTCATGDYWLIPARTNTRDVEWPKDTFLTPHGIEHHYCRLAIIKNDGTGITVIDDCRRLFPPLTEIDSCCGCCSLTVGKSLAADYQSIQKAVEALRDTGGQICVLPGLYQESVTIEGIRNLTLVGCGRRSVISPSTELIDVASTVKPLIHVLNSENIRIESLTLDASPKTNGVLIENPSSTAVGSDFHRSEPMPMPLVLHGLRITAGEKAAIEIRKASEVTISECEIEMTEHTEYQPAIFLEGHETSIERNLIYAGKPRSDHVDEASSPGCVSGIQIAGGSSQVRICGNTIRGLSGQGISLGSLEFKENNDGPWRPIIGRWKDPCTDCMPRGTETRALNLGPRDRNTRILRIASSLHSIHISDNQLSDTGLDGIGVISFFDVSKDQELVTVDELAISRNAIRGCLRLPPGPVSEAMRDFMGYGGISLANSSRLTICDNVIENNGTVRAEGVSGIFILHGEALDISRNHIAGNGSRAIDTPEEATEGTITRNPGGVRIMFAVARPEPNPYARWTTVLMASQTRPAIAFPALHFHDNIVSTPHGTALHVTASGPVSVIGNYLASSGARKDSSISSSAATVYIENLGASLEAPPNYASLTGVLAHHTFGKQLSGFSQQSRLFGGSVLFVHNQCSLDLARGNVNPTTSSVTIKSLGDVLFEGNQCHCSLSQGAPMVTHVYLKAHSLRVLGNKFEETFRRVVHSAFTSAYLNTVAHNQATHCLAIGKKEGALTEFGNMSEISIVDDKYCARPLLDKLKMLSNDLFQL